MDVFQVKKLYQEECLSAHEIGERLGKSVWQVIKFMKKHNIPRRSATATRKLQFERQPLSFEKKHALTALEKEIYLAGLMLYWGEGTKSGMYTVDFTNSDKRMVLIFLRMLREIFQIKEERLRVLLYCYANQNFDSLIRYWSRCLKIPKAQFLKPYIRQDFDLKKAHKMPYGLIHVRYNDKKLLRQIMQEIDIIAADLLGPNN
jgi:hypothetical protein